MFIAKTAVNGIVAGLPSNAQGMGVFQTGVWHNASMLIQFPKILLFCAILLLSGCSWLSWFNTEKPADAITIVNRLNEAAAAQTGAKPPHVDLPVRVNYSFKSKPAVATDLEVEIEYMALKPIDELMVGYTTGDGLALAEGAAPRTYTALKQFDVITRRVIVVPSQENRFVLSLYVVTKVADEERGEQITVPIAVGRYSLQAP